MNYGVQVFLDDYCFVCTITDYRYAPPFNGPAHLCDSDYDFYGYEEIDYDVDAVLVWVEEKDQYLELTDKAEEARIISKWDEQIKEKLLEEIRDEH